MVSPVKISCAHVRTFEDRFLFGSSVRFTRFLMFFGSLGSVRLLFVNSCGSGSFGSGAVRGLHENLNYKNTRIPQTMISCIPLILGLGTRTSDLYVYVSFWSCKVKGWHKVGLGLFQRRFRVGMR